MNTQVNAVLTGDIAKSTSIEGDYRERIKQTTADIQQHLDRSFRCEIFRGDSFQGIITNPGKALSIGILYRTGLRRFSRTKLSGKEAIWDARISIGIGKINNLEESDELHIGQLDGEAFTRSGKALDSMKKEKSLLKISTGDGNLDSEFYASCAMADEIIGRWSNEQSEAIYLLLLENLTQQEIGDRLGVSQRAVSKRLEIAGLDSIKKFLERYKNAIEWKYNK